MKSTGCVLEERIYTGEASPPATFEDESRFGNDGTHTSVTWVREPSGLWVRSFVGDGKVVIPDDPSFNIITTLTVSVWVKVTDVTTALLQEFVSRYVATTANREWRIAKNDLSGKVTVLFGDPTDGTFEGRQTTDDAVLVNGTWARVGFTFNAGTVIIDVDGVAVNSSLVSGAIPATLFNGTADLQLGAQESASYLHGSLVKAKIRNFVESPEAKAARFQDERSFFGV